MQLPTSGPVTLRDRLDVAALASYLRSSARTRPVALLTVPPQEAAPPIAPAALASEFGSRIDVVTLPTDDITRAFVDLLGEGLGAYRGACRVYPPGEDWLDDPSGLPLFLARTPRERAELPRRLTQALHASLTADASPGPAPAASADRRFVPARPVTAKPAPRPVTAKPAARAVTAKPAPPPRRLGAATAAPPSAPSGRLPEQIVTAEEARQLASLLLAPDRGHPVVVVTSAAGASGPYVDAGKLRGDLSGLADVHEISTLEASWAFSHQMPEMCQVYGGASRVYPVGLEWVTDPYLSPLRFAYGTFDGASVTRRLTADALSMASRGSFSLESGPQRPHPVAGEVIGLVGERALVQLPGGDTGVLWPELVEQGVPAQRLFAKGMRVEGTLDPVSRRIDVREMRRDATEALAGYRNGETILGQVVDVRPDGCTVELFPGYTSEIGAEYLSEDGDDVRSLVARGDVLALYFAGRHEDTGEWLLSLLDSSDPELATPAPSILRGGPPWLLTHAAGAGQVDADADQGPEPTREEAQPTPDMAGELLREKAQLVEQLRASERRAEELEGQLAAARRQLRAAERRRKRAGVVVADERLFEDDADQFDFEVNSAWARMTTPSEKGSLTLRPWRYGPEFFATLNAMEGVAREKVVEVIVHVLTGRGAELASRELHQLRTGPGGDDPPRIREGGETCWRVSLQVKTPSARRLHYWQCNDGSIELASIRKHDDMRA